MSRPLSPTTRPIVAALASIAAFAGAAPAWAAPNAERPLNFIVLLVDDWGWTDAGHLGSDLYRTPHIDALAKQSVRFTDAYAACAVCSPTRAALLTGKYPARLHLTDYIPGFRQPAGPLVAPDWTRRLEHRHTTIAEALGSVGYRSAHVGKWHLTPFEDALVADYLPDRHGFEINLGGSKWGQPGSYFHPYRRGARNVDRLPPGGQAGDYLTDRLTSEAINVLRDWSSGPFFLYFAYYAVHTPIEAKADRAEAYAARVREGMRHHNAKYAAMIEAVDDSVGRLRSTLEELGIASRTVLLLTSDNGGLLRSITNNAPLRSGKGSPYEGGVRVPLMVHWPGVTDAGAVCHEPVITMDLYPTITELAGLEKTRRDQDAIDGMSLTPLLDDATATLDRDALFWHFPHYRGEWGPYGVVRSREWRLVQHYEDDRTELYHLPSDPSETRDLAATRPEKANALVRRLSEWRDDVGAQMPTEAESFDPTSQEASR